MKKLLIITALSFISLPVLAGNVMKEHLNKLDLGSCNEFKEQMSDYIISKHIESHTVNTTFQRKLNTASVFASLKYKSGDLMNVNVTLTPIKGGYCRIEITKRTTMSQSCSDYANKNFSTVPKVFNSMILIELENNDIYLEGGEGWCDVTNKEIAFFEETKY